MWLCVIPKILEPAYGSLAGSRHSDVAQEKAEYSGLRREWEAIRGERVRTAFSVSLAEKVRPRDGW